MDLFLEPETIYNGHEPLHGHSFPGYLVGDNLIC